MTVILFEKTSTPIDNCKVVAQVIPGAVDSVTLTEDLVRRAAPIADECDAAFIHFNAPATAGV